MVAFRTLRQWFDGWAIPSQHDPLPAADGACVTLRLDGQVVGRGTAVAVGPTDDRTIIIRRAALEAFADADRRAPIERDALREAHLRELGPRLIISLELAGPLTPISPATPADLDALMAPGLDGLAVGIDARLESVFPAAMLSSGQHPAEALGPVVARLTDDPTLALLEPAELVKRANARFYRFRCTHLAQTAPGRQPLFLFRGSRYISQGEIASRAALGDFATSIADHIARQIHPGAEHLGLRGSYMPWKGQSQPPIANPPEQALAILALARFAALESTPPAAAQRARAAANRLLAELARVGESEPRPEEDAAACGLLMAALSDLDASGLSPAVLGGYTARLRRSFDARSGFEQSLPLAARAAAALGLASDPATRADAGPAVRRAFTDCGGQLYTALPMLGWAELRLADRGAPIPSASALREMRSTVWRAQVTHATAGPDRSDMIGGIVFNQRAGALPDWNTARPLAFIATMLGDERLTPAQERPQEIVRLLAAMRFLRQLTADDSIGWMAIDPAQATGGVRSAAWDGRMPPSAAAMTLLAVTETLRSLDGLVPPEPRQP